MNTKDLLVGAGAGAALALMLDPASGRRRRALMRDKVTRITRKTREGISGAATDLWNRIAGLRSEVSARASDELVDDTRLVERVRSELGRASTHPRAIDVFARNGTVTLRGPILESEVNGLITAVSAVRGVRSVVNQLEPHGSPEGVPSLQGAGRLPRSRVIPVPRIRLGRRVLGAAGLAAAGTYLASRAGRAH
jgi:gas vesicle protein